MDHVDVLVVTDPRFAGGTAAAVISDVRSFSASGLKIGLYFIESRFFDGTDDQPSDAVLALSDLSGVIRVSGAVNAQIAFLHHPLAFAHGVTHAIPITARRCVVVAHHPPFRGDGSLEYNPIGIASGIRAAFGCNPWWAPVSGVIRSQLRSFTPFLVMTSENWVNTFDPGSWQPERLAFMEGRAVVGRHGRPDLLKWPATSAEIEAPLRPGKGWHTRIMGCPTEELVQMGVQLEDWDVLAFNAVPVKDFLEGLDAFSYFYHPRWVEAFGRTIAEAILMGRPCVLDPRLEPTFGSLAEYCSPADAPAMLERLRADPARTRKIAAARREQALEIFSSESNMSRLLALAADRGTRARDGLRTATPLVTLRKMTGLKRRNLTLRRT